MKLDGLKRYLKANPGAIFILTFQALLASAAAVLVLGNSLWANEIATYAFYALVVGVAIQIGILVREERKHAKTDSRREASSP